MKNESKAPNNSRNQTSNPILFRFIIKSYAHSHRYWNSIVPRERKKFQLLDKKRNQVFLTSPCWKTFEGWKMGCIWIASFFSEHSFGKRFWQLWQRQQKLLKKLKLFVWLILPLHLQSENNVEVEIKFVFFIAGRRRMKSSSWWGSETTWIWESVTFFHELGEYEWVSKQSKKSAASGKKQAVKMIEWTSGRAMFGL